MFKKKKKRDKYQFPSGLTGLSWHQILSSSNWSILNFGSTGYSMIYMVDSINNIFDKLINHVKLFSLFPNYVRGRHTQMSIYACIVRRLDQFSLYHIFGFLVVYCRENIRSGAGVKPVFYASQSDHATSEKKSSQLQSLSKQPKPLTPENRKTPKTLTPFLCFLHAIA